MTTHSESYTELIPLHIPQPLLSHRPEIAYLQNPRRKRSKLTRPDAGISTLSTPFPRPKPAKKPDPAAPKITRPCSECGKKFWSWKALFGHMRCHPERQWRGINPPASTRRPPVYSPGELGSSMTEEEHEVAACLLSLANGSPAASISGEVPVEYSDFRFECSSCKKVFGSHQALGGHRASHKNVKGCFAIARNEADDEGQSVGEPEGHRCGICFKVFSSGQALGGHKRCHWERGDDPEINTGLDLFAPKPDKSLFDLNFPPARFDDDQSCYHSGLSLDLRLMI